MGKKVTKKGTTGNVRNFITRTQAVKKLQISLPDFRRLCIFKGIYPREPRSRKKASKSASHSTTFYYTRDIQYLLHEPLINKFRDHKALAKKIGRALGRGEVKDAQRMHRTLTPKITLDHIIKDRYPTFVDALRDLDDCLSMLFLFANLPSTTHVSPGTIAACQRLCLEFQHYLIVSHSLRKSFLSIKGIYYQATIQGQDVLWLVPYKFVQRTAGDIDFRIMGTFIEFYITLLGFVNFRLYTSAGLVYPPKFNASSDEKGAELGAYSLEGRTIDSGHQENGEKATNGHVDKDAQAAAQAEANKIAQLTVTEEEGDTKAEPPTTLDDEPTSTAIDTFEVTGDDADTLLQPEKTAEIAPTLFAPFTFYLSRETPRQPLEFILKAFGCKRVGWDTVLGEGAFTSDEMDPNITHQVVDRPPLAADAVDGVDEASQENVKARRGGRVPGRVYVQPQWVWDCVNQGRLLRPDLYGPGATLPPHLSPWTKPKKGQYDPTAPLAEQEREGEAEQAELEAAADEEAEEAELEAAAKGAEEEGNEDEEDEDEEDENEDEEMEKAVKVNGRDSLLDRLGDGEAGEGMDVALGNDREIEEDEDAPDDDDWSGFGDDEVPELDDAAAEALQHQRELEAEAMGLPLPTAAAPTKKSQLQDAKKKAAKKRRQEEEELERQKMMLSKKKRKMVEGMMARNEKADVEAQKLREKRRKLEMKV